MEWLTIKKERFEEIMAELDMYNDDLDSIVHTPIEDVAEEIFQLHHSFVKALTDLEDEMLPVGKHGKIEIVDDVLDEEDEKVTRLTEQDKLVLLSRLNKMIVQIAELD